MKHLLPCPCGQTIVIEPPQAGQDVVCRCGRKQTAPSMLQIKVLPEAVEKKSRREKSETGSMRRAFFFIGIFLTVVSLGFLVWVVWRTRPLPRDVSRKDTYLSYNGTLLYQNSTPIPRFEHEILWIQDEDIDAMPPLELSWYYKTLKDPMFGMNFQENWQDLKDRYAIRITAGFVALFLGLLSFISLFFMPKRNVVVSGWSGTEWE